MSAQAVSQGCVNPSCKGIATLICSHCNNEFMHHIGLWNYRLYPRCSHCEKVGSAVISCDADLKPCQVVSGKG